MGFPRFAFAVAISVAIGALVGFSLSDDAKFGLIRAASAPPADQSRAGVADREAADGDANAAGDEDETDPLTTQVVLPAAAARSVLPSPARDAAGPVEVVRETARTYRMSRASSSTGVRVTFLTPSTFRIHSFGPQEPRDVPDYMRVKADSDYAPVAVKVEQSDDGAVFATETTQLHVGMQGDLILARVGTGNSAYVRNWTIDPLQRVASLDLASNEHIYGFGDKRAALDQRGHQVEMLNRDAFASENNESYKSIPFYISSSGYGLFFHNFYPSVFDVGAGAINKLRLAATGGEMDFYVFAGTPKDVIAQYTELTGRPAMLPRWAFGYHQGKASYEGRDAFNVAAEMRSRKLPVDVIYYDDWDDDATAKSFIDSLWRQHHVRLTLGFGMPMFGTYRGTDDSALLADLGSRNFLMVDRAGHPAIGPDQHVDSTEKNSEVAYLDYFSPRAVEHIFAKKWNAAIRNGAILGMVDFGELDHVRDADSKYWPSLGLSVAQTRNLYGLVYPLSIMKGVQEQKSGRSTGMVRPGFAGTQRLGWSTTGDSMPTYRNFRAHTRAMINLTLSGFSNVGQDIGGWDHKGPDVLYARWFAAGTFHPFMWSHGQDDHEPYAHGEAVEQAAREFLNLRYRLLPYFYSLHELAHRTGIPMLRSFPLQEATDPVSFRVDDQYFLGDHLMVAPLFNDNGDRRIYLPKGLWYDFFDQLPPEAGGREIDRSAVPLDRLPVYVRGGAIIPLGPVMQYSSEKPVDPLAVHVYSFSAEETARRTQSGKFELYEDDGLSKEYRNGKFQRTELRFEQSGRAMKLEVKATSGDGRYAAVPARAYEFYVHGVHAPINGVRVNGVEVPRDDSRQSSAAHWRSDDTSGNVVISIPRSAARAITVEFATAPAWTCRGSC